MAVTATAGMVTAVMVAALPVILAVAGPPAQLNPPALPVLRDQRNPPALPVLRDQRNLRGRLNLRDLPVLRDQRNPRGRLNLRDLPVLRGRLNLRDLPVLRGRLNRKNALRALLATQKRVCAM
jgi:hypothetical protein